MEFQEILYEVADHVATITLNRPEPLNAFTGTMGTESSRRSTTPMPTTTSAR